MAVPFTEDDPGSALAGVLSSELFDCGIGAEPHWGMSPAGGSEDWEVSAVSFAIDGAGWVVVASRGTEDVCVMIAGLLLCCKPDAVVSTPCEVLA